MKMQDELSCFATSLNMTIVHSKMAPIQVVHSISVIALKSPGVTSLCYCSIKSSIDKDSMTSSYIHQIHKSSKRADYQKDISIE